jgi:prolyl-tRNA editing enzyme YbaK/EbsC (Cys-tRNA(Pro) deacylase)
MASDDIERAVITALDRTGVPYDVLSCDPDLADTAEFSRHYGYPLESAANTIIVASKRPPKQYAACVVRGDRRLDVNKTVKQLMGVSRLSFASPDDALATTGMALGGVTVFGLPDWMPIFVDDTLMAQPYLILGAGSRSAKIKVAPTVFDHIGQATIVAGLTLGQDD